MPNWLKQSTSVDVPIGPFLDETDGKTAETALTITQPDIRLKKGSAAWAQKNAAQTLTHEENGWYEVTLDATDTNTLGPLVVAIHESGALPVWREFMVVPANVYDSIISGSDALQVHANEITNNLITAAAINDGAITAAKIATGAIDADAIAADAVTEIQAGLSTLDAAGVRAAVDLAAANLDTQLIAIDDYLDTEMAAVLAAVDTEVAAIKAKTDNLPASPAATGDAMTLTAAYDFAKGTTAMTESYAANGAAPTPVQAIMGIHQMLMQFGISGTSYTVKKLDNTTTAFVVTLDDATNPSAASRV